MDRSLPCLCNTFVNVLITVSMLIKQIQMSVVSAVVGKILVLTSLYRFGFTIQTQQLLKLNETLEATLFR